MIISVFINIYSVTVKKSQFELLLFYDFLKTKIDLWNIKDVHKIKLNVLL